MSKDLTVICSVKVTLEKKAEKTSVHCLTCMLVYFARCLYSYAIYLTENVLRYPLFINVFPQKDEASAMHGGFETACKSCHANNVPASSTPDKIFAMLTELRSAVFAYPNRVCQFPSQVDGFIELSD